MYVAVVLFGQTLTSHSAGETTYNLDTAGGLRMEVQKYYELIDALRYIPFTEYVLTNFKSLWIKVC